MYKILNTVIASYCLDVSSMTTAAAGFLVIVALYLLRRYMAGGACKCTNRLDDKTVVITGANLGVGKATALALAKRGARVVLACRDLDKAQATADELKRKTKNSQIVIAKLDLSSLASVRRFCDYIGKSERRLDILINNAGIYYAPRSITEDGNELTFQTNYLGHFLATLLLLNKMRENVDGARIINVSSKMHHSPIDFDYLDGVKKFDKHSSYAQSKLAQILFTRHLATKLTNAGEFGVTVNALHPGVVRTGIFRTLPWLSSYIGRIINWPLMLLLFKSTEEGAQTSVHCAISDECRKITGRYFKDCKMAEPQRAATDDLQGERLWKISLKLVGLSEDDPSIACLNVSSKKLK